MTGGRGGGSGRGVLLCAAGLHMMTQSALAPFYPELFRSAYGVTGLAATGLFLMVCQLSAVIAIPLWGRATRSFALTRLVTVGQGAAVLLAASLAFAPSYAVFTALSVALIAAKSVVLLAYPSVARSHSRGLLPGVVQYVAVLHAASVAATLLGTVVVSVPEPRLALPLLAVAEGVLLGACVWLLGQARRSTQSAERHPLKYDKAVTGTRGAAPNAALTTEPHTLMASDAALTGTRGAASHHAAAPPARPPATAAAAPQGRHLAVLAGFVLANAVAIYAVRPYFTEYATAGGASTTVAALLFLVPHLAVLAVLPLACALRARLGAALLPLALGLGAVGLAWQAVTTDPTALGVARLLFGAGLGFGQVTLDERVLTATGDGSAYSTVAAAQTGGLLLAPLVATATASAALWLPLLAGAVLLAALALLAPLINRTPRTTHPDLPDLPDLPPVASPPAALAVDH